MYFALSTRNAKAAAIVAAVTLASGCIPASSATRASAPTPQVASPLDPIHGLGKIVFGSDPDDRSTRAAVVELQAGQADNSLSIKDLADRIDAPVPDVATPGTALGPIAPGADPQTVARVGAGVANVIAPGTGTVVLQVWHLVAGLLGLGGGAAAAAGVAVKKDGEAKRSAKAVRQTVRGVGEFLMNGTDPDSKKQLKEHLEKAQDADVKTIVREAKA